MICPHTPAASYQDTICVNTSVWAPKCFPTTSKIGRAWSHPIGGLSTLWSAVPEESPFRGWFDTLLILDGCFTKAETHSLGTTKCQINHACPCPQPGCPRLQMITNAWLWGLAFPSPLPAFQSGPPQLFSRPITRRLWGAARVLPGIGFSSEQHRPNFTCHRKASSPWNKNYHQESKWGCPFLNTSCQDHHMRGRKLFSLAKARLNGECEW